MVPTTAEDQNAVANLEEEKVVLTTAEYQNAAANLEEEKVYSQVERPQGHKPGGPRGVQALRGQASCPGKG